MYMDVTRCKSAGREEMRLRSVLLRWSVPRESEGPAGPDRATKDYEAAMSSDCLREAFRRTTNAEASDDRCLRVSDEKKRVQSSSGALVIGKGAANSFRLGRGDTASSSCASLTSHQVDASCSGGQHMCSSASCAARTSSHDSGGPPCGSRSSKGTWPVDCSDPRSQRVLTP